MCVETKDIFDISLNLLRITEQKSNLRSLQEAKRVTAMELKSFLVLFIVCHESDEDQH